MIFPARNLHLVLNFPTLSDDCPIFSKYVIACYSYNPISSYDFPIFFPFFPISSIISPGRARFLVLAPGSLPCASLAPRLVRLPCDASVEALQQAVAEGQAKTAAAMLTALGIEEPHNVEVGAMRLRLAT